MSIATPEDVVAFWRAAGPDRWYKKDDAFDAQIRERFRPTYEAGLEGRLSPWEATPDGALALVILLDQFPRNMFRGSWHAFAADPIARAVADRAIGRGYDKQVDPSLRAFFFMPFMHSENLADQERCIELSRQAGDDHTLKYAELHADIIRRFGRFPHRNPALGRPTTPEEQAFLDGGGFPG